MTPWWPLEALGLISIGATIWAQRRPRQRRARQLNTCAHEWGKWKLLSDNHAKQWRRCEVCGTYQVEKIPGT